MSQKINTIELKMQSQESLEQDSQLIINPDLVTAQTVQLGMQVQTRHDWPASQYGRSLFPANKIGTVIAFSDAHCNKYGETNEFIDKQLQYDQIAVIDWGDDQAPSRIGFAGEYWIQKI